jgi:hypothetical protein
VGETPPGIVVETLDYSKKAVDEIDAAAPLVTLNKDEFARLQNDIHCIREMTQSYDSKAEAAMLVLRYQHSADSADMEQASARLADSLEHFKALAKLTESTYRAANSMQTSQRKIPAPGGSGGKPANYHWTQLLDRYDRELADFQTTVSSLKRPTTSVATTQPIKPWQSAKFKLLSKDAEMYSIAIGAMVFTDRDAMIDNIAPELAGLTGIRFSHAAAVAGHAPAIEFEATEPVRILIGYFQDKSPDWLKAPDLETNARADDRGGVEPVLLNALTIPSIPSVNVHALRYEAGRHMLEVNGGGSYVILGVIPQSVTITKRDVGLTSNENKKN